MSEVNTTKYLLKSKKHEITQEDVFDLEGGQKVNKAKSLKIQKCHRTKLQVKQLIREIKLNLLETSWKIKHLIWLL